MINSLHANKSTIHEKYFLVKITIKTHRQQLKNMICKKCGQNIFTRRAESTYGKIVNIHVVQSIPFLWITT